MVVTTFPASLNRKPNRMSIPSFSGAGPGAVVNTRSGPASDTDKRESHLQQDIQGSLRFTPESNDGLIFASIDCFDAPPRPSIYTSPTSTPRSISRSSSPESTSSPGSSIVRRTGAITPQLSFDSYSSEKPSELIPSGPSTSSPSRTGRSALTRSMATLSTMAKSSTPTSPPSLVSQAPDDHEGKLVAPPNSATAGSSSETSILVSEVAAENKGVEILGGGALYALIGARIWLPPAECRTLIDREARQSVGSGGDMSIEAERYLEGYGKGCWRYVEGEGRRMVRARIRISLSLGAGQLDRWLSSRYKPLVPAIPRTFSSLLDSPIRDAQYLHIAPPYCPDHLEVLLGQVRDSDQSWRPKIVYEPHPMGCHPGQRSVLERILAEIDVLSHEYGLPRLILHLCRMQLPSRLITLRPNHEELLSLYSRPLLPLSSSDLGPTLEEIMTHILSLGLGPSGRGIIVVRCGRLGSVVGTRQRGIRWFPAYWQGDEEHRVKDVTGAGNAYLGGYIAGLSKTGGDPYAAVLYATVSAGFVVEQMGLPKLAKMTAIPFIPFLANDASTSSSSSPLIPPSSSLRSIPSELPGKTEQTRSVFPVSPLEGNRRNVGSPFREKEEAIPFGSAISPFPPSPCPEQASSEPPPESQTPTQSQAPSLQSVSEPVSEPKPKSPLPVSPLFSLPTNMRGQKGDEMWNDDVPSHRLRIYRDRIGWD